MEHALGDSLVHSAGSNTQLSFGSSLIAAGHGLTELTDLGAHSGADGLVTLTALFVGEHPLLLGLNICHNNLPLGS